MTIENSMEKMIEVVEISAVAMLDAVSGGAWEYVRVSGGDVVCTGADEKGKERCVEQATVYEKIWRN